MSEDNWSVLIKEYGDLIGSKYVDLHTGVKYRFFGLVWGEDDLYYGMSQISTGEVSLLSCVGHIEDFGLKLIEKRKND